MGSLFYSFQEAASRLGVSKRSIHNYVKRGYIRKANHEGNIVLIKEDVEQLAADTGVGLPAFNQKNFFLLLRRVEKLEQDMLVARRRLDIELDPLRPNQQESALLMKEAEASLLRGNWVDEEIKQWVHVFERLDETALENIKAHTGSMNPFVPFFKLAMAFMAFIAKDDGFNISIEKQLLHKEVDTARIKMRKCIFMWMKVNEPTNSEDILQSLETDKDKFFKKLKANKSNPSA